MSSQRIRSATMLPFRVLLPTLAIGGLLTAACDTRDRGAEITKAPKNRTEIAVPASLSSENSRLPVPSTPVEKELPVPETPVEWVQLARERIRVGDAPGAIEACDAALVLQPALSTALHQKGRALWALDRGHEAVVTLEAARRAEPENGHIANTLGYLLITRGEFAEAIPHLEVARTALPGLAYVRNNLGVAYERAGAVGDAVEEYRAAVAAGDSAGKATASLARLGHDADPVAPLARTTTSSNTEVAVAVATEDGP